MRGIDQALCGVTQLSRPDRIAFDACSVAPGVGTVDRDDIGGATFDDEALPRVSELQAIAAALGAKIGGEIFGSHQAADGAPARHSDRAGLHQAARELDVRQQRRRSLGDAVVALEPCHRLVELDDMVRLGDLRQRDDIRMAAHHRGKIVHAVLLQRIDADRDHPALVAPGRVELDRQRPRLRAQRRRGEVLELVDQHVGAAGGCALQDRLVGAFEKQPGAAQRGRAQLAHHAARTAVTETSCRGISRCRSRDRTRW